ncbi:MAG: phosphoribosyl-AMP cyclohydrolase [Spirochaetota bacterium]|nr:MAG: phosphoribosyl-AMP cyclohydrolase [Spirochaetota bacterium]
MLQLNFEKLGGLLPVIAQDYKTQDVLMMAFMNQEAWKRTRETGYVHYYSRSRNALWKKGEQSGNLQEVKEIRIDCDSDCLLIKVNQIGGAACHEGYHSCFYRRVTPDGTEVDGQKVFDPEEKYGD